MKMQAAKKKKKNDKWPGKVYFRKLDSIGYFPNACIKSRDFFKIVCLNLFMSYLEQYRKEKDLYYVYIYLIHLFK